MKKVMFICTGNICRSAMAHGMLAKLAKDKNKDILVYSCGINAYTGNEATSNAIIAASEYNVDIQNHQATNISDSRIKDMDLILCATNNHKRYVLDMYPDLKDKIYTMKEYVNPESSDLDIRDPWGNSIEKYRYCAKEIYECLENMIDKI